MKDRLLYIDKFKGIAIFLVVCGHFIQYNVGDFEQNELFSIIYSFHMPLFMFISGYVTVKTTNIKIFENYPFFLRKKVIVLLVPFFSWQLIVLPFFFVRSVKVDIYQSLILLIKNPSSGLWFLWFLFFLVFIYSIFLFFSDKLKVRYGFLKDVILCFTLLVMLFSIRHFELINYIDSFILYFIFFFIGVFTGKYNFIKKFILNKNVFSISLLFFILLSGQYEFANQSIQNLILKLVISLSAIISLYYLVNNFLFYKGIDSLIVTWGQNSLIIYSTHFYLIDSFVNHKLSSDFNIFFTALLASCFAFAVIICCLYIFKIVEMSKILNFMLFGSHKSISIKVQDVIQFNEK